ncbi:MAG: ferrochelatase [Acidobacteriota bacterium]
MVSQEAASGIRGAAGPIGVLIANTGTPDAPAARAVRRYLREFLSDPQVVDLPRPLWWPILNLFILPFRPLRSARLYAKIWTQAGSPLLVTARKQAAGLEARLRGSLGRPVRVTVGMRYGRPALGEAIAELLGAGCARILLMPLFPQYSGATTGSVIAAVQQEIAGLQSTIELASVIHYHDEAAYIRALTHSVREVWNREGEPDRLLVSFHGLPERRAAAGDPYRAHCEETARLLAAELELSLDRWRIAYQSRFGPGEWLKPYADQMLREWAAGGVGTVDVICPGFSADCLETLEEITIRHRAMFLRAGGRRFRYIPALNDRADHVEALCGIALRRLRGWLTDRASTGGS